MSRFHPLRRIEKIVDAAYDYDPKTGPYYKKGIRPEERLRQRVKADRRKRRKAADKLNMRGPRPSFDATMRSLPHASVPPGSVAADAGGRHYNPLKSLVKPRPRAEFRQMSRRKRRMK